MKYVAFVCGHNSGRSQMSQAIFNTMKKLYPEVDAEYQAISWGTGIGGEINPKVVGPLKDIGIDVTDTSEYFPKDINHELVQQSYADVVKVFTMGCMNNALELPEGKELTGDWALDDPAKDETDVNDVRNTIIGNTLELLQRTKIRMSTVNHWVSSSYLSAANQAKFKKQFCSAKPFSHLELKNFFVEEKLGQVAQALVQEEFELKNADLFQFKQTRDLKSSHNPILHEFRDVLRSKEFLDLMESLTGISLKTGTIDLHGSLYEDTDYLLCHDDQLDSRRIAFLLYLSNFTKTDGGSLDLLDSKFTIKKNIIPKVNSFTFFEVSETSYHQVSEVVKEKQRLALGGWFHDQ